MYSSRDPRPRLYVDIETYCSLDLRKHGVYQYTEYPDFEILMASWALDGEPVTGVGGEISVMSNLRRYLVDPGILKVAHNSSFERACFSQVLGRPLDPEDWDDTLPRAYLWGFPGGLDALAVSLGLGRGKDKAGSSLIRMFCMPRRGRRVHAEDSPERWEDFRRYNDQDVEVLRDVDLRLPDWPPGERKVWEEDQRINERGIRMDVSMARSAEQAALDNSETSREILRTLTGNPDLNPNSVQQLQSEFKKLGLLLPDLRKETVQAYLESGPIDPLQRKVLEVRADLALSASKKYRAGLDRVSEDGRLRGSFVYHGAHTGRWTGRGLQPQNLPREQFSTQEEQDSAISDLDLGLGADPVTLKKLVRSVFIGPFVVMDYAAIEARVVAWLAGETWALEAFRAGRDIYVETAERMGARYTRSEGKVAVLALGYNGAVSSLMAMGFKGTESEAVKIVRLWRANNPNIVDLWGDLERCFRSGGQIGEHLRIEAHGSDRHIILPSQRPLVYRDVKRRNGRWTFSDGRGRADTYGGRLCENVTQAVARDILAQGLLNLREAGQQVVAHVHDEVIVEGTDDHAVKAALLRKPAWAKSLPLDGKAFVCDRYRKERKGERLI